MSSPPLPSEEDFIIVKEFIAEKTSDVYLSVLFSYEGVVWDGVIPKYIERQGINFTDEEISENMPFFHEALDPTNRKSWTDQSEAQWVKRDQTYDVLKALYSGVWECRVHGPVPKANPQPSARIQALKKKGYIIGSERKKCDHCEKKTMHDILVMLPFFESRFEGSNEMRKQMPNKLAKRIKRIFNYKESCFNVTRSLKELIIDHKFPSQRWGEPESNNPDDMPEEMIKQKFQLLSNQTNLWKSRFCDRCVKEGRRGDFMGITWYYEGNENWGSYDKNDEKGCIGCPWYDLEKWKQELLKALAS